uniref:Uncharacterized protein n=1 Tax=Arundo donax TaxID=35708 RepID=A0A0A8XPF3_ARUDO
MHRRIGAPHRYTSAVAIWVCRTPGELRDAIPRHRMPIKEGGAIWGSPTEVHRWRCAWGHVSPRCGVVGRGLHRLLHGLRVICRPGLVAVAHVARGAEREVDVLTAGADPVVLTPSTVGARALPGGLAAAVDLRRHGWWWRSASGAARSLGCSGA